jgi:hypothetical protein
MGTYTDLLKLKKPSPQTEQPSVSNPPPLTEPSPIRETIWEHEQPVSQTSKHLNVETDKQTFRQTSKTTTRQTSKRRVVHHGIDVYRDQILMLNKIQFALWRRDDKKPTLRELFIMALDHFIEKMKAELPDV